MKSVGIFVRRRRRSIFVSDRTAHVVSDTEAQVRLLFVLEMLIGNVVGDFPRLVQDEFAFLGRDLRALLLGDLVVCTA